MRPRLTLFLICALLATLGFTPTPAHANTTINIPDPAFKYCITRILEIAEESKVTQTQMASITELDCRGTKPFTDLTGWEHLTNARSINLHVSGVVTVPPTLLNLTELSLNGDTLTSLTLPTNLTKLTKLALWSSQLTKLTLATNLTNLTELFIYSDKLASLTLPTNLPNLKALHLDGDNLTGLTLPSNSPNLTELHLDVDNLTSLTLPTNLPNFTELVIFSDNLASLTLPTTLPNLTWLGLYGDKLPLLALTNLPNLTKLGLRSNQIRNVTLPNNALPQLRYLHLAGDQLTSFTVPTNLANNFPNYSSTCVSDAWVIKVTHPAGANGVSNGVFIQDGDSFNDLALSGQQAKGNTFSYEVPRQVDKVWVDYWLIPIEGVVAVWKSPGFE